MNLIKNNNEIKKFNMHYRGLIYGKIGRKYFPTGKTSDDFDEMEQKINELEKENLELKKLLQSISVLLPSEFFTENNINLSTIVV